MADMLTTDARMESEPMANERAVADHRRTTMERGMTETETRAVDRLVKIADRIEEFRENTEKRKPIPALMLQELRMARKQVKTSCGV